MKIRHLLFAFALAGVAEPAQAQFGSFGDIPIEITADGETRFMGGVAIAENNVVIHYGTISIYADYAQYNPDTRDVLVVGNVRIYRDGHLFVGERALYNLESKLLRTGEFSSASLPYFFEGESVSSLGGNAFQVTGASLTTSDSSKPDYRLQAGTVRLYPNSHVVMTNVKLYIGKTPVFWFPFVYQSLSRDEGFHFTPGYDGNWGAYLLTQYGFPVSKDLRGALHLDLRSKRGLGLGMEILGDYGRDKASWLNLNVYYAQDQSADTNPTANRQEDVGPDRYRISFQDRTFFTDDIYASVDFNKLSDRRFLRDFYPNEYRTNPQPDSVVSVTKRAENYTLSGILRGHPNSFFDTTQRLPEVVLDLKRQPIFGNSGLFYEGETGVANLRRDFARVANQSVVSSSLEHYQAVRIDSFHQVLFPKTFGGWLSVIPRIGVRGTHYTSGAESYLDEVMDSFEEQGLSINQDARTLYQRSTNSPIFRPVFNAGVESSFKFSREWEEVQSRRWGLDGLRHIVQPYTNLSYVYSGKDPDEILQFDRLNPSTQLPPIDFPQFTTIDTIPTWTIWRLGVRNRWQTRRDDRTFGWLDLDSYFDVNIDKPDFPGASANTGTLSNFYNRLRWTPLPWFNFGLDTQIPLSTDGFTQVNTTMNFMVNSDLHLTVGHRYLDNNPYFSNSNTVRLGGYYRLNDNWGVSFREQFEFQDRVLEIQEYAIHRDLSSWIASLGVQVRDNHNSSSGRNQLDYSLILTFTLKDLPSINLPVAFDPSSLSSGATE
jgi:LPS-assembly protein